MIFPNPSAPKEITFIPLHKTTAMKVNHQRSGFFGLNAEKVKHAALILIAIADIRQPGTCVCLVVVSYRFCLGRGTYCDKRALAAALTQNIFNDTADLALLQAPLKTGLQGTRNTGLVHLKSDSFAFNGDRVQQVRRTHCALIVSLITGRGLYQS